MFPGRVIDKFAGAEHILLLGCGPLKSRLEERIGEPRAMAAKLVGVIDTDRMTERQIVVRVRAFYRFPLKREDRFTTLYPLRKI